MQLLRYARIAGFVILALITVFGVHQFVTGDWNAAAEYWRGRLPLIPVVLLLAFLDVALEGVAWLWVYARFGMRAWNAGSAAACLTGRAGLLLPVQLGRLIRPDAMTCLGRGPLSECLKAEAVVFVLDTASVGALLVGLIAFVLHPLAGPLAALATVALVLILGNRLAHRLSKTQLGLTVGFWWSWQTFAIVLFQMGGWIAHGAAFYLLIRGLPGNATLGQSIFFSAGSAVAGAGTGLPGGLGATEGLLGASLSLMAIPAVHLAVAVVGFRLLTFWIWIPIGWLALIAVRRCGAQLRVTADAPPPSAARMVAAPGHLSYGPRMVER